MSYVPPNDYSGPLGFGESLTELGEILQAREELKTAGMSEGAIGYYMKKIVEERRASIYLGSSAPHFGESLQESLDRLTKDDPFRPKDWDWHSGNDARYCEHEWTWTGNPGGQVFCKLCDVNHRKDMHGEIPDLSNRLYK